MRLTHEQLSKKVTDYIASRMLPSSGAMGRVKLGFIIPMIPHQIDSMWHTAIELGIADADTIDCEMLGKCLTSGMDQVPELNLYGFKFTVDDARDFESFINA